MTSTSSLVRIAGAGDAESEGGMSGNGINPLPPPRTLADAWLELLDQHQDLQKQNERRVTYLMWCRQCCIKAIVEDVVRIFFASAAIMGLDSSSEASISLEEVVVA